ASERIEQQRTVGRRERIAVVAHSHDEAALATGDADVDGRFGIPILQRVYDEVPDRATYQLGIECALHRPARPDHDARPTGRIELIDRLRHHAVDGAGLRTERQRLPRGNAM